MDDSAFQGRNQITLNDVRDVGGANLRLASTFLKKYKTRLIVILSVGEYFLVALTLLLIWLMWNHISYAAWMNSKLHEAQMNSYSLFGGLRR